MLEEPCHSVSGAYGFMLAEMGSAPQFSTFWEEESPQQYGSGMSLPVGLSYAGQVMPQIEPGLDVFKVCTLPWYYLPDPFSGFRGGGWFTCYPQDSHTMLKTVPMHCSGAICAASIKSVPYPLPTKVHSRAP